MTKLFAVARPARQQLELQFLLFATGSSVRSVKFFAIKNSLPYKGKEFLVLLSYLSSLSMRTSSPAVISQPASVFTAVAGCGSISAGNTIIEL